MKTNTKGIPVFLYVLLVTLVATVTGQTGVKSDTVIVTGKYVMGENDSRTDAKQFALLDAKRKALEQFGTYLTSQTTVENYQLTQDQITTYTMGLMKTNILEENLETEGDYQTMLVKIQAVVDPAEVDESLKNFAATKQEGDDLPDMSAELQQLSGTPAPSEMGAARLKHKNARPVNLKTPMRNFERKALLTQIVVESRKPKPNLKRINSLVNMWQQKYPRAKFVEGYLGIALYKNGQKKAAAAALKKGIQNLKVGRRLMKRRTSAREIKLMKAQEAKFQKYLSLVKSGQK